MDVITKRVGARSAGTQISTRIRTKHPPRNGLCPRVGTCVSNCGTCYNAFLRFYTHLDALAHVNALGVH